MALTLDAVKGRICDLDAHEAIPLQAVSEVWGDRAARFAKVSPSMQEMMKGEFGGGTTIDDTMEITEQSVWEKKTYHAPSHADLDRRPAVLDMMGIQRQLIFPGIGLIALTQALGGFHMKASEEEQAAAWEMIDAYNEWAIHYTNKYKGRVYISTMLGLSKPGSTPESIAKETERLIKAGTKGIYIATGQPPCGHLSPGDPALDSFYAQLAEADVPLISHPPSGVKLFSDNWHLGNYGGTWVHLPEENFIAAMVTDGVFERHPKLRYAAIECGASWIGPLAEFLDFWMDPSLRPNNTKHLVVRDADNRLKLRPSEYINRNIRVAPLAFEPVQDWFVRYPHIQDVYTYSSDFPHEEGQQYSVKRFFDALAPLGEKVVEKFFVTNGQLIVP